jgi:hypothetical protein
MHYCCVKIKYIKIICCQQRQIIDQNDVCLDTIKLLQSCQELIKIPVDHKSKWFSTTITNECIKQISNKDQNYDNLDGWKSKKCRCKMVNDAMQSCLGIDHKIRCAATHNFDLMQQMTKTKQRHRSLQFCLSCNDHMKIKSKNTCHQDWSYDQSTVQSWSKKDQKGNPDQRWKRPKGQKLYEQMADSVSWSKMPVDQASGRGKPS